MGEEIRCFILALEDDHVSHIWYLLLLAPPPLRSLFY